MAAREPCLLLAEVSGSERLLDKLGAAEMRHAVLRCLHRMERVAVGFRGELRKALGEASLMAEFESTESAHLAAGEMQQRVLDLPPVSGVKLALKISFPAVAANGDAATAPAYLHLRHGGVLVSLGPDKAEAALGRDLDNDIVIRNPRASRNHARIVQRRDSYVLIDQSSNGTFAGFAGGPEIVLQGGELILAGSGYISCGSSYGAESDEIVEFSCSPVEGE